MGDNRVEFVPAKNSSLLAVSLQFSVAVVELELLLGVSPCFPPMNLKCAPQPLSEAAAFEDVNPALPSSTSTHSVIGWKVES